MPDMEKVIEAFDEAKELVWTDDDEYTVGYNNGLEAGKDIALALLKDQPQLVRCKDCKFGFSEYGYVFCTKPYVEKGSANHKPDWFCADGERRDKT